MQHTLTIFYLFLNGCMAAALRWVVNSTAWIPTEQEWCGALSLLQPEELTKVGQFVYQRDAKFSLIGRLLIRGGLSELIGGHSFQLARSERGKPMLLHEDGHVDQRIGFNISHQGDYVVLAAERGQSAVGVDVMQLTRPCNTSLEEFFQTMKRQFTNYEWSQITPSNSTPDQCLRNFYRQWCLKESFIKAKGDGLAYGLQNLEFTCDLGWPPPLGSCCTASKLHIRGKPAEQWRFEESLIDKNHCVSVATPAKNETEPLPFSLVTVQHLLSKLRGDTNPQLLEGEWKLFQQKPKDHTELKKSHGKNS